MQPNGHTTDLVVTQAQAVPSRGSRLMPILDVASMIERRNQMLEFVHGILTENVDYGVIPGSDRKVLLKPGAEKLVGFFGLEPKITDEQEEYDWTGERHNGEAFFFFRYKITLSRDGVIMGEGIGSANSWESKYRYRWCSEDRVPAHLDKSRLVARGGRTSEFEFAVKQKETGGKYGKPAEYWAKFQTAIDNGTATRIKKKVKDGREMDAWEIDSTEYRIPNNDVADVVNTLQKMAQKRALVQAVLLAVGASEFFTQDLEDFVQDETVVVRAETVKVEPQSTEPEPQQNTVQLDDGYQIPVKAKAAEPSKPVDQAPPQGLTARTALLATRMNLPPAEVKKLRNGFFIGWFGITSVKELPSEGVCVAAFEAIESHITDPEFAAKFISQPRELGNEMHRLLNAPLVDHSAAIVDARGRVMARWGVASERLTEVLKAHGALELTAPDLIAYLKLMEKTQSVKLAILESKKHGFTIAALVAAIEKALGKPLAEATDAEVETTMIATASTWDGGKAA